VKCFDSATDHFSAPSDGPMSEPDGEMRHAGSAAERTSSATKLATKRACGRRWGTESRRCGIRWGTESRRCACGTLDMGSMRDLRG